MFKLVPFVAFGTILFGTGWSGQEEFPHKVETTHYSFHSRVPEEKIKDFTRYMELVFETYSNLLKVEAPKNKKFRVNIFADSREYYSEGKGPRGSAAYYSPETKNLVGYYNENRLEMYNIFAHEGMHQFVDIAFPDFQAASQRIPWYTEGIADCIGNSQVKDGKLYMGIMDGAIAEWRIKTLIESKEKGRMYSLKDLLNLDLTQFYADSTNCYAHAWSFCHFLLTAPKLEDTARQVPDGKYKLFLAYFHEAIGKKWSMDKAYDYAFQYGNDRSAMPKIDALDKEWKEYIGKLIEEYKKRQTAREKEKKKIPRKFVIEKKENEKRD